MPGLTSSYWLRGHPPELRVFETYAHLSVIGAITPHGQIFTMIQDHPINSAKVVAFLNHLRHFVSRKMIVVWDRSKIHRSEEIRKFLKSHPDITVRRFPPYAPDLNPMEGVWEYLKHVRLRNVCTSNLDHLHAELTRAIIVLRAKPMLIKSFFRQPDLNIDDI